MTLLFISDVDPPEPWLTAITARLPDLPVAVYPTRAPPETITYALVWRPPSGYLASLPNLKAVFSLGAGVDDLIADPSYPRRVPLIRMVDRSLTAGMVEYVVLQTLYWHREQHVYAARQRDGTWRQQSPRRAADRTVGLLGLGVLGLAVAEALADLGFAVAGWSRSPRRHDRIDCHHGPSGLGQLAARADILVCLLPLTPLTAGILNADLFAAMPEDGVVINVGRGRHLVDADLLAALDSGQLRGASLDVFHPEPLIAGHPFWRHPNVVITPHVASLTLPVTAVDDIVATLDALRGGRTPDHQVDFDRGY